MSDEYKGSVGKIQPHHSSIITLEYYQRTLDAAQDLLGGWKDSPTIHTSEAELSTTRALACVATAFFNYMHGAEFTGGWRKCGHVHQALHIHIPVVTGFGALVHGRDERWLEGSEQASLDAAIRHLQAHLMDEPHVETVVIGNRPIAYKGPHSAAVLFNAARAYYLGTNGGTP